MIYKGCEVAIIVKKIRKTHFNIQPLKYPFEECGFIVAGFILF